MHIAIIGAGVTGLAAASLLADDGYCVTLFEAFPEPRPVGSGLLLQPPALAVLDRIGVRAGLQAGGARIGHLLSLNHRGAAVLDLDYTRLAPRLSGLGLNRGDLFEALYGAVQKRAIPVYSNAPVTALEQDSGMVRVTTRRGGHKGFDLAIIANGSFSQLTARFERWRSRLYPWGARFTNIDLPGGLAEDTLHQRLEGCAIMAGVLPTGGGRAAFFWSIRHDTFDPADRSWLDKLGRLWPEVHEAVCHAPQEMFLTARYNDNWIPSPFAGRILAMGDAAHGTSPQLGQGGTQGLLDAAVLADCLKASPDADTAMRAWWKRRKGQLAYIRWASRSMTPVFQSNSRLLGWGRDMIMPRGHKLPVIHRQVLRTLAAEKTGWLH